LEKSEGLVNRILNELGDKAVPKLVDLLFDEDAKTAELSSDILKKLNGCTRIRNELDKRIESGESNVGMFYAADLLGEMKCSNSKGTLYRLLGSVKEEKEAIIVYGALLRLGEKEAEKYLLYEFEEDPYMKKYLLDIAIALEPSDNTEVFISILKESKENKEFMEVVQSMCNRNPSFLKLLPNK